VPVNSVTLVGNMVDDPELSFTPSGIAKANIRVAVNRIYNDRDGNRQEETSFFGGTLWREAAENASESLKKGMRVIITGSLEQRSWENKEGERRSVVEVRIDEMGPSLRWASAQVRRNNRTDPGRGVSNGGDWGGQSREGGDWNAPPPVPVGGTPEASADEAPF